VDATGVTLFLMDSPGNCAGDVVVFRRRGWCTRAGRLGIGDARVPLVVDGTELGVEGTLLHDGGRVVEVNEGEGRYQMVHVFIWRGKLDGWAQTINEN